LPITARARPESDHPPHRQHGVHLPRPAVDEVPDEHRLPVRVAPGALELPIAHSLQQREEHVGLAWMSPMMS